MHENRDFEIDKRPAERKPLSRREFARILGASAAGTGVVAASLAGYELTGSQRAEAAEAIAAAAGKLPLVPYGKCGFKVTPLCMAQDWGRDLFAPAVEMGVNFIHKAGYWGGRPVPEEIAKLPRESYYTDITVDNTS
ncbi:MAG TPA: hypothetical protein VKT77_02810, partial [Chthonomonadaceae bacterium]|nr:hypothetical protein [Chthonomonadaceae bacterium]